MTTATKDRGMKRKQGKFQMLIFDKTIVTICRAWRSKWWTIKCCGCSKWKRRTDGTCKHERAVLSQVRPELLPRTRIEPTEASDKCKP